MQSLVFSGFNGFGQFGGDRQRSVNALTDISLEKLMTAELDTLLIAVSWSYAAYATGNQLLLRGFLSGQPNSTIHIRMPVNVAQLATSDRFCLVLCENGILYKLRVEIDAQPEEVKLNAEVPQLPQKRTIFGLPKIERACGLRITHIACGSSITAAISETNGVFSVPSKIHQFPKQFRVRQLQCGFEHALLLSANGDLYSWGNGFRAQLGQDTLRVEEVPVLIEALAGIKINFIAAGGWHSAAISAFGDLYTWGFNSNGQLGLRMFKSNASGSIKQPTVFALPQIVEISQCECLQEKSACENENTALDELNAVECDPVKVFAGARHTLLQMNCGALYAAGWNAHGQLGLGRKVEYCDNFEKLTCERKKELNVVCGAWCTVLIKKS